MQFTKIKSKKKQKRQRRRRKNEGSVGTRAKDSGRIGGEASGAMRRATRPLPLPLHHNAAPIS
jgi:hypothetical protein